MVSDRPDVSMGSMLGAQEMAEVRVGGGGEPLPMVWQTGVSMGRGPDSSVMANSDFLIEY